MNLTNLTNFPENQSRFQANNLTMTSSQSPNFFVKTFKIKRKLITETKKQVNCIYKQELKLPAPLPIKNRVNI